MTPIESAQEELQEVSELLQAFAEAGIAQGSAEWIAMQSLQRRQADLIHEIALLEGRAEIEIRLVGGAEDRHAVEADFLGGFIREVQAAVSAITQTLVRGVRGSRGTFPNEVVGASTIRVAPASVGSFVIHMHGPAGRASQFTIEGDEQLPPFDEAVLKLRAVMAASAADNTDALRNAIADVGSHRALVHLDRIARAISRTRTNASIVQRAAYFDTPQEASMTAVGARRLQETLRRTDQVTETIYATGRLSGVLWRRGFFELERTDGGTPRVIAGRVVAEIRQEIQGLFDSVVDAELERTTTIEAGRESRTNFRLVGVGDIPRLGAGLLRADDGGPRSLPSG